MIPSHHQRNSPNRLIKCSESSILGSTPSLIDLLQVPQGPSLSLTHNLVDYRSFPAPEKEEAALQCLHIPEPSESTHEKRRTLLRERQTLSSSCQPQPQSVRRSMVDLIPPTKDDDDSSDEESEVMFALKVSRPARLVPRPTTRTRRGSVEHWGNGSIAALSLLDESIALQSSHKNSSSSSHNLAKLAGSLPRRQTVGDFSQSCVPNHDSFQTSANFSIPLLAPAANATGSNTSCNTSSCSTTHKPDPRKQRKSMMNWLANRQASRHLLDRPSKDPQPPVFVKVIYLPEDLEELDMEDPIADDDKATTQPEDDSIVMGSKPKPHHNIAPAIQRYLDLLENSYQHKVASSTA